MKKNMIFLLLIAAIILSFGVVLLAQSETQSLFEKGNELYRHRSYEKAYSQYEQVSKIAKNADVFYNMGNAAFKKNQLGLAMVNYERARRISPRDKDILENLKFAKSTIEFRVEDKRNWFVRTIDEALIYVRFKECMLVVSIVYFVLMAVLIVRMMLRKPPFSSSFVMTMVVLFVMTVIPATIKFYQTQFQNRAIVTQPRVEARYGPSLRDQLAFRLVEGIEVLLSDESEGWYRITLANGDSGWIPKEGITII